MSGGREPTGDRPEDDSWRLDPALARIAFGATRRARGGEAPRSVTSALRETYGLEDAIERDLSDPAQRAFGDYELLEVIGHGGMGVVYRAREHRLEREVAIKLLSAGPGAPEGLVETLRSEARHAARLQHPNIVAIYGMEEQDDQIFYAMQLVRGSTLSQRIDRDGPLAPRAAARLLRVVAEAVDYAHRFGVLHLDLKPGNLLLDGDGTPLVADFGLARPLEQQDVAEVSGTPGCMAPEQAAPGMAPLSPATDVWALGAILHEMLTGKPPFQAEQPEDAVALVLHAPTVAPSQLMPTVPADLDAICLHCLQKDPVRRYPDARALADDLGRFLEGRPVSVRALGPWQRVARWTRREPRLALASAALLLALLLGLSATATQWWRAEANADHARQQSWDTRGDAAWRSIEAGDDVEAQRLLAANLAERERSGDTAGAELERLRLGSLRYRVPELIDAIATGLPGRAIALDRAATRIAASVGNEQVRLYDVADGRELWRRDIRDASHFWPSGTLAQVAFTRDGAHLLVNRGDPEVVTRPSGHDNILIDASDGRTLLPPADRFPDFRDATYAMDGRFAILRNHAREAQLFRVDGWHPLTPKRGFGASNEMWRLGDAARFIALSDLAKLELWDPRTLDTRFVLAFEPGNPALAWDSQPGGALLALGYNDGKVQLLDCDTRSLRDLRPAPPQRIQWIAFSDDGRRLAAVTDDRAFVWDVASGRGAALPARGAKGYRSVEIDATTGTVFASGTDESALWRLPVAGDGQAEATIPAAGARTLVTHFPSAEAVLPHAIATRPSARLAASLDIGGELRLWRWREQNAPAGRTTPFAALGQHFDGRHVVVARDRVARVLDLDGDRVVSPDLVHPQPVSLAALAADGRSLVTVSGRELRVFDWRSGRLRFAPARLEATPLRVALSPDAGILLASTGLYRNGRFHERLSTRDLDGRVLAEGVEVPGPITGLRFDADGRRLLLWRHGEVWLRDAITLAAIGGRMTFGADSQAPPASGASTVAGNAAPLETPAASEQVQDALPTGGAGEVTAITRASSYAGARLSTGDASTGRILRTLDLGKTSVLSLLGTEHGIEILASRQQRPARIDDAGRNHLLASLPGEDLLMPYAVGGNGRWLATATPSAIVLTDRASDQWGTAPLPVSLPADDALAELRFSPDGRRLLARSHHGRWLWWSLEPESRPAGQLSADVQRLQPRPQTLPATSGDTAPWPRPALRARDPGAGATSTSVPQEAPAPHPAPAAPAASGYAFLDLGAAVNRRPESANLVFSDPLGYYASVPSGVQRYLGIDFDIRGVVALSMRGGQVIGGVAGTPPWRSASLAAPIPEVDAVHLLLGACCLLQGLPVGGSYGFVVFEYADGAEARVPVRYQLDLREPWNDPGDDLPARIAWVESSPRALADPRSRFRLYAARHPNPRPSLLVARVRFEASDLAWSGPLVFAATLEARHPGPSIPP